MKKLSLLLPIIMLMVLISGCGGSPAVTSSGPDMPRFPDTDSLGDLAGGLDTGELPDLVPDSDSRAELPEVRQDLPPDPCEDSSCGDGQCREDCAETGASCPEDCCLCGDGICSQDCEESQDLCPEDCCGNMCGNQLCDLGCRENLVGQTACPVDCCSCGDLICNTTLCQEGWSEDLLSCATDCAVCGNETCDPGEGPVKCQDDCCGVCGDGRCRCGETPESCMADCGLYACGDATCDPSENPFNCLVDCVHFACGNHTCEPGEDFSSCPEDCSPGCGDCHCNMGESYETCPVDCGYCGDGYCIEKCSYIPENHLLCPLDCCLPSCQNRECGDNGCGGSCGTCQVGWDCGEGRCLCQPDCTDRICGDDGCGGSCGLCGESQTCTSMGTCLSCETDCTGKVCGDDGCGGSCGQCGEGHLCVQPGQCLCMPQCQGRSCGDDGCGGSCGQCPEQSCRDGLAESLPRCVEGACLYDKTEECNDGSPCTTDFCVPGTGCFFSEISDIPCDDGNPCTGPDICQSGQCLEGPLLVCDDGNPCTQDLCDPVLGCTHLPIAGACDDRNDCTHSDTCQDGVCRGIGSLECDDQNPCTRDICHPTDGCLHEPFWGACTDGNPCTLNDQCQNSQCIPGPVLTCDDGNECTLDACDLTGRCGFTQTTGACNDGNICTTGDQCVDGLCVGVQTTVCDDGNPCTRDVCDPIQGCTSTIALDPCDDGNACTLGDTCLSSGQCIGNSQMVCNDGNPCTDDACSPELGCAFQSVGDGTTCGTVPGWTCNQGTCTCQPTCLPGSCGDDGCGGSCGGCPCGNTCVDGTCKYTACDDRSCGDDGCGGTCGTCPCGNTCISGTCINNACSGKVCGDDGCGGSCGSCPCGFDCVAGKCLQSSCAGKVCGDDGCGGSCGTCPCGHTCGLDGQCVYTGCDGKSCGEDGCGGSCGVCQCGWTCSGGICLDSACAGRQCGPDGCGGSCGVCQCGFSCQNGQCMNNLCADRECGVDECGTGSCGSCQPGSWCNQQGRCVQSGPNCGNNICEQGESCEYCPQDCGNCMGDCCVAHDSPGCRDAGISNCVCMLNSSCCLDAWTSECVGLIPGNCGSCYSTSTCPNGTCDDGEDCTTCPEDCSCSIICGDLQCQGTETCATCPADCGSCQGSCCLVHSTPGCEDSVVMNCVCGVDQFCCTASWDSNCVARVTGDSCGVCCAPNCEGRMCGDDGCGGSCGQCPASNICGNSTCDQATGQCLVTPDPICTEALTNLRKIYRGAQAYYSVWNRNGNGYDPPILPLGEVLPLNSISAPLEGTCCAGLGGPDLDSDGLCDAGSSSSVWNMREWRYLNFRIDQPHRFTYRFTENGDNTIEGVLFEIEVTTDFDCDGITGRFLLQGRFSEGADPMNLLVVPAEITYFPEDGGEVQYIPSGWPKVSSCAQDPGCSMEYTISGGDTMALRLKEGIDGITSIYTGLLRAYSIPRSQLKAPACAAAAGDEVWNAVYPGAFGMYREVSAGVTPIQGNCCQAWGGPDADADGRCDPNPDLWTNGWADVGYREPGSHSFTYLLTEDVVSPEFTRFEIQAWTDPGCTGRQLSLSLRGNVRMVNQSCFFSRANVVLYDDTEEEDTGFTGIPLSGYYGQLLGKLTMDQIPTEESFNQLMAEPIANFALIQEKLGTYYQNTCLLPPETTATPLSGTCCANLGGPDGNGDGLCDLDPIQWSSQELWQTINFQPPGDHRFVYQVGFQTQDGDTVVSLRAFGDRDCNGNQGILEKFGVASENPPGTCNLHWLNGYNIYNLFD